MTVKRIDESRIELLGDCPSEDAEALFQYLLENRSATVDWSRCERTHSAVVQVLVASGCRLTGTPIGLFLNGYIGAALKRAGSQIGPFPDGSEMRNS